MQRVGYTTQDYHEGQRVQVHPASDFWMRGARYGTVVKITRSSVHVLLDATRTTRGFHPDNLTAV